MVQLQQRLMSACKQLLKEDWLKLVARNDTFLFDADGVLWNGNEAVPGSSELVQKLNILDSIITTSAVLSRYLQSLNFKGKAYVVGSSGIGQELDLVGIPHIGIGSDNFDDYTDDDFLFRVALDPEVRAVVVGFDGRYSYVKCMKAASYLKRPDCLFVATNDDASLPSPDSKYALPGTGTILASVEHAANRKAVVLGKPNQPTFQYIRETFAGQIDPRRTVMIGDRCGTDIKFAHNNDLTSIFVQSGDTTLQEVLQLQAENQLDLVPDFYALNLGELRKFLD